MPALKRCIHFISTEVWLALVTFCCIGVIVMPLLFFLQVERVKKGVCGKAQLCGKTGSSIVVPQGKTPLW